MGYLCASFTATILEMQASIQNGESFANATQLLPALRLLGDQEKLFIIQFLVSELSRKENQFFLPDQVFPVWSPHDSFGAAEILLKALNEHKGQKSTL